jgi:hypothetical protein
MSLPVLSRRDRRQNYVRSRCHGTSLLLRASRTRARSEVQKDSYSPATILKPMHVVINRIASYLWSADIRTAIDSAHRRAFSISLYTVVIFWAHLRTLEIKRVQAFTYKKQVKKRRWSARDEHHSITGR